MRKLNEREMEILHKKERRLGKELLSHARTVEYRKAFPRTTICILSSVLNPTIDETTMGITMRGRRDIENDEIGEVQSFVRALDSL